MTKICPTYVIVFVALFGFGIGYNWLVEKLERQGHDRGYMGFIVALGCVVTLIGARVIIGWEPVAWVTACFVASGIPMIAGSVRRHVRARAKARRGILDVNDRIVRRGRWPGNDGGRSSGGTGGSGR